MTLEVRTEADIDLMRHYLSLTSAECPILPTLHGISAFGSKLSFYKAQVTTRALPLAWAASFRISIAQRLQPLRAAGTATSSTVKVLDGSNGS